MFLFLEQIVVVSLMVFMFAALFFIVRGLLIRYNRSEESLDKRPVSIGEIEKAVKKYGSNTNSFVHLYGGVQFFKPEVIHADPTDPSPLVGYISLLNQNIMITDPLCSLQITKSVIQDFARKCLQARQDCLLFPISQNVARQAAELGFGVIQVGADATFDLKKYVPGNHSKKIQSAVSQVFKKGYIIEEVSGESLEDAYWTAPLSDVLTEWLESRGSEKMELIAEVSPFKQAQEKKYFICRLDGHIDAFLACSPVYGRNGFFLQDLIRRPTAVNGVSEALIVTALEALKKEGFDFATLGIASLAGLDEPGVNRNHPWINKVLVHIFNKHSSLYNFKGLYHFKKKFDPDTIEPVFFASYPPRLKLGYVLAIASIFSARGPLGDLLFKWRRWREGQQLPQPLRRILSPDIAILSRPIPFTLDTFLTRLKVTTFLFFLNIYTYFSSIDAEGRVHSNTIEQFGFSFQHLLDHKWFILVSSNFMHFNYPHLLGNMFMLIVVCGTLELVGGSTLTLLTFLIGMQSNIPMGLLLLPVVKSMDQTVWKETMLYTDVGASLGIMSALGTLLHFLRHKRILLAVLIVVTIVLPLSVQVYFGLDHVFGVLSGYVIGYLYMNRELGRKCLRNLLVSHDNSASNHSAIPFRSYRR